MDGYGRAPAGTGAPELRPRAVAAAACAAAPPPAGPRAECDRSYRPWRALWVATWPCRGHPACSTRPQVRTTWLHDIQHGCKWCCCPSSEVIMEPHCSRAHECKEGCNGPDSQHWCRCWIGSGPVADEAPALQDLGSGLVLPDAHPVRRPASRHDLQGCVRTDLSVLGRHYVEQFPEQS